MGPSDKQQKAKELLDQLPEEERNKVVIDNEGNMVANNRAYRRAKPPTDNRNTKSTHTIRKKRQNAKKNKHNR